MCTHGLVLCCVKVSEHISQKNGKLRGTCFDKYEKHETCLSMSTFLNLSHSPTFVMQNGDSGTSSPVKWTPDQWLKKNMLKAVFIFLYKKNVQVQDK